MNHQKLIVQKKIQCFGVKFANQKCLTHGGCFVVSCSKYTVLMLLNMLLAVSIVFLSQYCKSYGMQLTNKIRLTLEEIESSDDNNRSDNVVVTGQEAQSHRNSLQFAISSQTRHKSIWLGLR